MTTPVPQTSRYHVLLIGIDSYAVKPLHGCVNDIDVVQRMLVDKALISPASITRLASPHPDDPHETTIESRPATLANMRAALSSLGTDEVAPGDRVLIYYSGHGARVGVEADGRTFHRESLVPVDFNEDPSEMRLLYDFEFNDLLSRIAARTKALTLVLDCCHSAGATREVTNKPGMTARFIDPARALGLEAPPVIPPELSAALRDSERGLKGSVDDCQVVAACLNHELAQEDIGKNGLTHGLLTRALVDALDGVEPGELRTVPWGRVWHALSADISQRNPWQHPWISGAHARAVLAGPPADGDVGFGVTRTGPNEYTIGAGKLAGIDEGARLAVYADTPPRFLPLDSVEDRASRLSAILLEVVRAERSSAVARAEGAPFDLPKGVRARLVKGAERLRCAIVPGSDALAKKIAESPLLRVVDVKDAQVRLEHTAEDTWVVTDDIHGAKPDYPVLFTMRASQVGAARRVLEHYQRYALPLRMAERCADLPGALQLSFLACPKDGSLSPEIAQQARLPEVPSGEEFEYELAAGDHFCIRVRNASSSRLRVTLLNSAASGKVQVLGDQIIEPQAFQVFWPGSKVGRPFKASPPKGATECIDRMVAIGTTAVEHDIGGYLRVDTTFADMVELQRGAVKDFGGEDERPPPLDRWTATHTTVRTRA